MMTAPALNAELQAFVVSEAQKLGFVHAGFTTVATPKRFGKLLEWIAGGFHGDMEYMAEPSRLAIRKGPQTLLDKAKTIVSLALPYPSQESTEKVGLVARYAQGKDYHYVARELASQLAESLERKLAQPLHWRAVVDSAPLMERDFAEDAGLGFVGKNTLIIRPGVGSYFFLVQLLVDVELAEPPENPKRLKGCGSCQKCLDACPTGAFVGPFVLDARRCISYLTIEYRGIIPRELRPQMGSMLFGCDICQAVCPYNVQAPKRMNVLPQLQASQGPRLPGLVDILTMSGKQYKRLVKGTALYRASHVQMKRNACVVLGNCPEISDRAALREIAATDRPLVRVHAAWAMGRRGEYESLAELSKKENHPEVLDEIKLSLDERIP